MRIKHIVHTIIVGMTGIFSSCAGQTPNESIQNASQNASDSDTVAHSSTTQISPEAPAQPTAPSDASAQTNSSFIAELDTLFEHPKTADNTDAPAIQDELDNQPQSLETRESVHQTALDFASLSIGATSNALVQGTRQPKQTGGLPKNTRQVTEGYWLGSLPQAGNIDALHARKIKLIITATRTVDELAEANARMDELGITHLVLPFGGKFPKPSRFIKTVLKYDPDRIYIHCDHGGDRSGAMLAYLLVARHHWTIQRALLAVLYPGKTDINGLTQVLNSRGYTIDQSDIDRYLGIYSASLNGGGGGLKVRSPDYKKLINTLIDAIEKDA